MLVKTTNTVVFVLIFTFTLCLSANNNFEAATFSIDTSPSLNPSTVQNWNPYTYTILHPKIYNNGVSNVQVILSVAAMKIQHNMGRLQFYAYLDQLTQSHLVFKIQSQLGSNIQILAFRYLIIAQDISESRFKVFVQRYYFNVNLEISSTKSSTGSITYHKPLLPGSQKIETVAFINGLDIKTTSPQNILEFNLISLFLNQTLIFNITSTSMTSTFVKSFSVHVLFYNINKKGNAPFIIEQIQGTTPFQFEDKNHFEEKNLMIGIKGFSFSNSPLTDFTFKIKSPDSIIVSSLIPNAKIRLNYLIISDNTLQTFLEE